MTISSYADILRFTLKTQLEFIEEEMHHPFANKEYLNGIARGLEIALHKIDASMFLVKD